MKFVAVLFFSFFVYIQCTADQAHEDAITTCEQQSGVTKEILANFKAGQYDNPKLAAYLFCAHKVIGFQNEAGELQIDNVKKVLKKSNTSEEQIQKIEQQCIHNKETPEQTAVEFTKCANKIRSP